MSTTTVVIPTYRRPSLLKRAVSSALAQTQSDLEVWVYDNASGDETEEVVSTIAAGDRRLHYHRQDHNLGSFGNFNYAIGHVRTPFFSILADDDMLLPDFHRLALESFSDAPQLAFVGLDCLHSEAGGALLHRAAIGPGIYRPPEGLFQMLRQGHLNWTSVLFRLETIQLIGGLDPAADPYLDLDVLLRVAARAPFAVRTEPGAVYFYHEGAASSSSSVDSGRWSAFAHIIARTADDPALPPSLRDDAVERLRRMFRSTLFKGGVGAARRGNAAGAAIAASELRHRLGDWPAALAVQLASIVSGTPGGRGLLELLARTRRPYTGERLADRLRGFLSEAQLEQFLQSGGWRGSASEHLGPSLKPGSSV